MKRLRSVGGRKSFTKVDDLDRIMDDFLCGCECFWPDHVFRHIGLEEITISACDVSRPRIFDVLQNGFF